MRVIHLPEDPKEARGIFGILYTACFQGEGAKSHSEARTLAKVQDALEALTHEAEEDGIKLRLLNDGVTEIRLEDAHYELVKNRIFGAKIEWMANATRRVNQAYEALENAVEEKPGEAAA